MIEALLTFLLIGSFVMGYLAAPRDGEGGGGGGGSDDPGPWPELDRAVDEWSRKEAGEGLGATG
jgi:hypothetical protein